MEPEDGSGASNDEAAVVSALVVDCAEPAAVAEFWRGMLGGERVDFPQFDVVALRAPGVTFDFVRTRDDHSAKNRWHLDVATGDPAGTVARALALGGAEAPDICVSDRFTVMRDVEGNEFCVLHYSIDGPWVPPHHGEST